MRKKERGEGREAVVEYRRRRRDARNSFNTSWGRAISTRCETHRRL
jgi:hypothetical protein